MSDTEGSNMASPQSAMESPYSSPSQQVPQLAYSLTELRCNDNKYMHPEKGKCFLRIVEQPQDHFRFRYRSEMVGTHGCLLGESYGTSKTKTHPTVELVNYSGRAIIRCRLAQDKTPDEHPHKLLEDEQDRDVSYEVPEHGSYKVGFAGMGIIHTAKKDVPSLLFKKYSEKLRSPQLNLKDLRVHCENEAKGINLNIVRLRFSAHDINTDEEICPPVLSKPIHNMKSAATNDLKICRISRTSGRAMGGEDVFLLVEKVNKKNIMVRLFELNEAGEEIWTAKGLFQQSEVHHQYAIVFTTPPYKDGKTSVDKLVYIELVRPSDGRTSEPKEFKYKAPPAFRGFGKRKKTESPYSSICSSVLQDGHYDSTAVPASSYLASPPDLPDRQKRRSPSDQRPLTDLTALRNEQVSIEIGRLSKLMSEYKRRKVSPLLNLGNENRDMHTPLSSGSSSKGSLRSNGDVPATVLYMKANPHSNDHTEHLINDVQMCTIPQIPIIPQSSPSNASDLGEAILYGMRAEAAPGLGAPGLGVPDLQLNSSEFERILREQPGLPPDASEQMTRVDWSEYMLSFPDSLHSLPGENNPSNAMQFIRSGLELVADSGRGSKPQDTTKTSRSPKEEKKSNLVDKSKSTEEYTAYYKAEDGTEVKKLVKELCEMIRDKTGVKKQIVRAKLERLFDMRLSNGDTFLHMTLCSKQPSLDFIVKLIYNMKMTHLLNMTNNLLQTIFHLAVVHDMPDVVSFLASKGCNPMIEDVDGNNVIHYAVMYQACLEPLLRALKANNVAYDLNAYNNEKETALHLAVKCRDSASVRALVKSGASARARDATGRAPLHLAAAAHCLPALTVLLDHLDPSEIDATDGRGYTALQIVCDGEFRENTLEIVKLLLEKNADPLAHSEWSRPAWRLARHPALRAALRPPAPADVKSEPEDDDYESADEGDEDDLTAEELAALLEEIRGSKATNIIRECAK